MSNLVRAAGQVTGKRRLGPLLHQQGFLLQDLQAGQLLRTIDFLRRLAGGGKARPQGRRQGSGFGVHATDAREAVLTHQPSQRLRRR
jgi:hypothetical protein